MDIHELTEKQRAYFMSGATRPVQFRLAALEKLKRAIQKHGEELNAALLRDFRKPPFETYMTETGMILDEIRYHSRHLPRWAKNQRVKTPVSQFYGRSFISPEPYGVVLIMSPWNYPVQLCLSPLVGAISGGNCAIVKPSAYTPNTSKAIAELIRETFEPEYIAVVEGGREENSALLEEKFDYIFFTGSPTVGKVVMAAASKHLTPVTLELGGKSPAIVDESADIKTSARRIAFGKVLNAGQTCVEPDYLLIHESVKERFIEEFKNALKEFFPDGDMSDMPVIVNDKHFARITGLMKGENAVIGGGFDSATRFIEPTVLADVKPDSPIMQEEIFGPVLPVMTFKELDEAIGYVTSLPKPLALYLFTAKQETESRVLGACSFGGGCINDTIIHLATPYMPFGGVGNSGMGQYHGKKSFETFTHFRSVMKKSTKIDLPMRYHPYTEKKLSQIKQFLK